VCLGETGARLNYAGQITLPRQFCDSTTAALCERHQAVCCVKTILDPHAEFAGEVETGFIRKAHARRQAGRFAVDEIDGFVAVHMDSGADLCPIFCETVGMVTG
jgi:hypothetical protein